MLEVRRKFEPIVPLRFVCVQVGGDCPVGARDRDGWCLHKKFCDKQFLVGFEKFIVDR